MKPVVDRLEKQYKGKVEFRRINVETDKEGSALAQQFRVTAVPTFVFLNSDGSQSETILGSQSEKTFKKALDALK